MTITRRQALEAGAALGVTAAFGAGNAFGQTGALIQKQIPKSGEMLPPIGIGTNQYGVGASEEERAPLRETMARFVEMGGKVMDTAMIYGTSEAVIGDLAQQLNIRDRLFLATKTDIRGQLRGEAGLQQALTRMKTEMIDAMLVHNLVNADTELPIMREWQRQGKFRYIGASISTPNQFEQMEQFMRYERRRDRAVQLLARRSSGSGAAIADGGRPRHRGHDQRAVRRRAQLDPRRP